MEVPSVSLHWKTIWVLLCLTTAKLAMMERWELTSQPLASLCLWLQKVIPADPSCASRRCHCTWLLEAATYSSRAACISILTKMTCTCCSGYTTHWKPHTWCRGIERKSQAVRGCGPVDLGVCGSRRRNRILVGEGNDYKELATISRRIFSD